MEGVPDNAVERGLRKWALEQKDLSFKNDELDNNLKGS